MKPRYIYLLALCLSTLTACEKEEPERYPVTMRFSRLEPASDYLFYIGGQKIDDRARMERFRDTPIRIYPTGEAAYDLYWTEPDGSQFDRIDFPDKDHFRMLWATGSEDRFDVLRHDGMLLMAHPEESEWMEPTIHKMLRWRQGTIDHHNPQIGVLHRCLWGRFTSEHRFEMEWMQIRWHEPLFENVLTAHSNAIDPSKADSMGPRDTLVVRHYRVIFTR